MKIAIVPPQISRYLTLANVTAITPDMASPTIEVADDNLTAWFHASIVPDGVNYSAGVVNSGGIWTVEDAAGSYISGTSDGLTGLRFLMASVKRATAHTGAITAQEVALVTEARLAISVNTSTGTLTCGVRHGFAVGQAVQFSASALPTGLSAATDYFVISAGLTETAFRVSATRGGSVLVPSTTGTTVVVRPGYIELGRLNVPATGAGYEPVVVPVLWYGNAYHWAWGGHAFELRFSNTAAAAQLAIEVQAAGEN